MTMLTLPVFLFTMDMFIFAVEFKYLGATISNSLTSDSDVDKRQASAVFGALKATLKCAISTSKSEGAFTSRFV